MTHDPTSKPALSSILTPRGGIPIFKLGGILVLAHWTWLPFIAIWWWFTLHSYHNPFWSLGEIIAIFGIVLLHELGHCFATRSVGGDGNVIILWVLGGVSFYDPPPRPGAMLWVMAAGPLANLFLVFVFLAANLAAGDASVIQIKPGLQFAINGHPSDAMLCLATLSTLNLIMFVFNLLPIYPLDGGKILWALLWFFLGPGRSLIIAARIGMALSVLLGAVAWFTAFHWTIAVCAFMFIEAHYGSSLGLILREEELEQVKRSPSPHGADHSVPRD